jgi:signal transduction histidine kinase
MARLERLVPPALRDSSDTLRRGLLLSGLALSGAALTLLLAPVTLALVEPDLRLAAVVQPLIGAALYLASVLLLWRTGSLAIAGNWLVAWLFGQLILSLGTLGGLGGPTWSALVVPPVLAAVMIGRRAAIVWGALSLAVIFGYLAAALAGFAFPEMIERAAWPPLTAALSALSIVFLLAIVLMSETTKDEAIARTRTLAQRARAAAIEEERARHSANQAIAANDAKSAFMATMTHELRTPLNIVIGYGELLADEVAERGHHDLKEQADRVTGAARHLLSLISDILDLSRIEAERIELHLERIPLRPLVDELIESFEPLAQERGDRLIAVVDDALPPIRSDRLRLRQILVNLVTNAIKFTEGGQITVRVAPFTRDDRPWVRLCVEDTGIGIPQEKLVEIFAPFTQADASTTRIYGGAGLGLAICERLALALGGAITVTSQVGVGSAFTLEIPANPDDDATTPP